jgi:hypothetical protein
MSAYSLWWFVTISWHFILSNTFSAVRIIILNILQWKVMKLLLLLQGKFFLVGKLNWSWWWVNFLIYNLILLVIANLNFILISRIVHYDLTSIHIFILKLILITKEWRWSLILVIDQWWLRKICKLILFLFLVIVIFILVLLSLGMKILLTLKAVISIHFIVFHLLTMFLSYSEGLQFRGSICSVIEIIIPSNNCVLLKCAYLFILFLFLYSWRIMMLLAEQWTINSLQSCLLTMRWYIK